MFVAAVALLFGMMGVAAPLEARTAPPPTPSGNVVVDPTFAPQPGVARFISTSVVQPDGKTIVVGPFEQVSGERRVTIARLNVDGTLDPTLDAGEGFNLSVWSLGLQQDGKILAGGDFSEVDGVQVPGLVRLLANGEVDPSFDPQLVGGPLPIEGGSSLTAPAGTDETDRGPGPIDDGWTAPETLWQERFAQLSSGTGEATVVPAAGTPRVRGVVPLSDGKMLVYGDFLSFDGTTSRVLLRLNADGSADLSFTAALNPAALIGDVVPLPGGAILVVGYDDAQGGNIFTRLVADGSVDPTFAPSQCDWPILDLLRLPDGRLLASGPFTSCGGLARVGMMRLDANGQVDPTFNTGTGFADDYDGAWPSDMAVGSDGRITAVGYFTKVNGVARAGIARLSPNGALDTSFVPAIPDPESPWYPPGVWEVYVRADHSIVVLGDFHSIDGQPRSAVAGLMPNGALDAGYAPEIYAGVGPDGWVGGAAVEPDGKVMVVGGFGTYNGVPARAMARLNTDGTLDPTFSTVGTGLAFVDAAVRQPDGKYIVAGQVVISMTAAVLVVMRLNPDGSRDPSFAFQRYDLAFDQFVESMALQPDGKVLVAGRFTAAGGQRHLIRLTSTGAFDPSFSIGTGFVHSGSGLEGVRSVVLQPDGRILVGGAFQLVNGVARSGIARLLANGAVDGSFNPGSGVAGTQAMVISIVLQPDGRIVAAGRFDSYAGVPRASSVRINANGSLDPSYTPAALVGMDEWPDTTVTALYVQPDGRVIITGNFETVAGVGRAGFARLSANGALDPSLDPGAGFDSWPNIRTLASHPNGSLLMAGDFIGFNDGYPSPIGITRLAVVEGAPGVPGKVSVTSGDSALLVAASPPANAASSWVARYEFSVDDGATWPVSAATPQATIAGLTNDQAYQVRVRAVGLLGAVGPASAAVPGVPTAAPASVFVPVEPARVVDSRVALGGEGPIPAGSSRVVSLAEPIGGGTPVVPAGAVAVAYNLTVPNAGGAGHVRVMPGDAVGLSSASAINFRAGETIANAATVKVAPDRTVKLYAGTTVDVVIDVVGYFVPAAAAVPGGGLFTAVTPVRVYDAGQDPAGLLAGKADRLVSVAATQDGGASVVPAGASAVAYNVTVAGTVSGGHVRVMPGDVASSPTSAINWSTAGERIANGSVVALDAQRQIRVFNGSGAPVRFLVDVVGYYSGTGQQFFPIDPVRTTETRAAFGGSGPVAPGLGGVQTVSVGTSTVGGFPVTPAGATAVAYNATVVGTGSLGHLRVYPEDAPLVGASVSNWPGAGYTRANATTVGISPQREVAIYNGSTTPTDVLIDIQGYYQ